MSRYVFLLTHGKFSIGTNKAYVGMDSPETLITSKDNPLIYEEEGTLPPFENLVADADTLEGHPASYFATANHTHSQYALKSHTHTISQVTSLQSEIDSLKSSVSNGKSAVASAITDKGVSTSATASFDIMAANIGKIQTEPALSFTNTMYFSGHIDNNYSDVAKYSINSNIKYIEIISINIEYNGELSKTLVLPVKIYANGKLIYTESTGVVGRDNIYAAIYFGTDNGYYVTIRLLRGSSIWNGNYSTSIPTTIIGVNGYS